MRRLLKLGFNTIKNQPLKRWTVPLGVTAFGLGCTAYAQSQQSGQQSSSVVNLEPIKYSGKDLQVQLKNRDDHLKEIQNTDEYDVIIIGGGCNGAGVFLDAANRGLKCLLLESNDFAAATSSKSTKLIHGGIRYLQDVFEFSLQGGRIEKYQLVKEALRERTHFVENAYYMNRQIPFIVPTTNFIMGAYYYVGVLVYHAIYWAQIDSKNTSYRFKMPQWFGRTQLKEYFPHLDPKYKYGIVYYDGQFNDTRMNMDILLTGTQTNYNNDSSFKNGNILNYAEVKNIVKDEKNDNKGVVFKDKISDRDHTVKGKIIVNCAGSFADEIRFMDNPKAGKRIIPVAGSHIVMDKEFCSRKHALVIPKTEDGRILFLVPWLSQTLIGTTERQLDEAILNPTVSPNEMIFMAKEVGNLYSDTPSFKLSEKIQSKWAGIRPLILASQLKEGEPLDTKKLARTHVIEVSETGLISLLGGKWTVYRCMGEETVDEIFKQLKSRGHKFNQDTEKKSSLHLRLLGEPNKQQGYKFPPKSQYVKIYANSLVEKYDIEYKVAKYLIKNYGMRAFDILSLAEQQKNKDFLKQKLHPNHPILRAEILYHVKYEMAQYPIDVLFRRTRLGFLDRKGMFESLKVVCDIFAQERNWNDQKKNNEKNGFLKDFHSNEKKTSIIELVNSSQ